MLVTRRHESGIPEAMFCRLCMFICSSQPLYSSGWTLDVAVLRLHTVRLISRERRVARRLSTLPARQLHDFMIALTLAV